MHLRLQFRRAEYVTQTSRKIGETNSGAATREQQPAKDPLSDRTAALEQHQYGSQRH